MSDLSIDMEVSSEVDLAEAGSHVYAAHRSTEILCMAYGYPGEELRLWRMGEPCPDVIRGHLEGGGMFRAWNALGFEALIWKHICAARMDWPEIPAERWVCTMQEAQALGLPGKLDTAAKAVRLTARKDPAGARLIRECCIGVRDRVTGLRVWHRDEDRLRRLGGYCMQDVRVEMALSLRVRRLPSAERRLALLDATVNARGVSVDMALVLALTWITGQARADLNTRMVEITLGAVPTTDAVPRLKAWLASRGVLQPGQGLAKDDILGLLDDPALPGEVRVALNLRLTAAKSSTAKLSAFAAYGAHDGRARGMLAFLGAATGRWAGRGPQPQNMPRAVVEHVEAAIRCVFDLYASGSGPGTAMWALFEEVHGQAFDVVSRLPRSCIVARRGKRLHASDLAGIESRVLAWMAGEVWKLDLFRSGGDVYLAAGPAVFGRAITRADKFERLVCKVAELACGYQGSVGAFASMGVNYGVKLPEDEALRVVRGWRAANPRTVQLWWDLNDAAIAAVSTPGVPVHVRPGGVASRLVFWCTGGHLWFQLPSGRCLRYANATMGQSFSPTGGWRPCVKFWGLNSKTRQWEEQSLYGGLLAENATQAVARDVLVEGMWAAEAAGLEIVLTVHDEILAEADEDDETAADRLHTAILSGPASAEWTRGLPLDAETDGNLLRYRK